MKIALIDNMNNNFFSVARYLRGGGIDADLFVIPGASKHFAPECDTFDDVKLMSWIKTFPSSYQWTNLFKFNKEIANLKKYDVIIACGQSMWLLNMHNVRVDLFIPYGSDLYETPFWSKWPIKKTGIIHKMMSIPVRIIIAFLQKRAIRTARVIITNPSHKIYKEALTKIGRQCVNLNIPMLINSYKFPIHSSWNELSKYDFVVFNHSRHIWSSNPDKLLDFESHGGNKRNDKLIRAFARFVKITNFKYPRLVTFEYGPDVADSKKLIQELGIEDYVIWKQLSPRKEIMNGLRFADFGVDQLRHGISGIGGVGYEVIASGVPLITHTNGAISDPAHPFYNAPIIDILEEDQILNVFIEYEKNPEDLKQFKEKTKQWFERNLGGHLVSKYVNLIDMLNKNNKKTTSESLCELMIDSQL